MGTPLGTNKRYPDAVDRRVNGRVAGSVMRDKQHMSLLHVELDLAREPFTRAHVPRRARAWGGYGDVPLFVDCEGVAWNEFATAAGWQTLEGAHHAWVRASAVRFPATRP